jgi:adenosylhomocysteine nucleosidase
MKLGILGAMSCEIALLQQKMTLQETVECGGRSYYLGQIGPVEVIVVCCGIGKVNAALCTQTLIQKFGADHIINTGVAGGVDPAAKVFDVIVSTSVCYHDFTPGILQENFPYCEEYPADEQMVNIMNKVYRESNADYALRSQRIVTGDVFVESNSLKESIASRFAPGCVDMESGAVGQVCYILKTPFLALRSLSDTADDEAGMSFDQFAAKAADHSAGLIISFCMQAGI